MSLESTVDVKCLLKRETSTLDAAGRLEGTWGHPCPGTYTYHSSLHPPTAVISSTTAGTTGAGAGFGFSGAGTYGYRPSSVSGGYGMLSGGCVTGSGNCSPRGEAKTRLGSVSEFKDPQGKTSALSSPAKKTTR